MQYYYNRSNKHHFKRNFIPKIQVKFIFWVSELGRPYWSMGIEFSLDMSLTKEHDSKKFIINP